MRRARLGLVLALTLSTIALVPTPASAQINKEPLLRLGSGLGTGAGQLEITLGIATDPTTGHIYVAGGGGNNRIDEFTPWGEFVKSFGWDVAPGVTNEAQEVRVRAAAGAFVLKFGGASTASLPFDATGGEVESALNALATIVGVGGSVSVRERVGAIDGTVPFIYVITFHGSQGGSDVVQIEAEDGVPPLSGGDPSTELEARTRADGSPGGAGFEACTTESGCREGLGGGGAGQLRVVGALAVNGSGDIFVREGENNRVQEFGPSGQFILMFGGDVNRTKVEAAASEAERNLCTEASGDTCQAGTVGGGKGQFAGGSGVATIGATTFVGSKERIEKFNVAGEYLGDLPDPGEVLKGRTVRRLAADPISNRLYLVLEGKEGIPVLDPISGAKVGERKAPRPQAVAVDPIGNLFVLEGKDLPHTPEHVVEFDPAGNRVLPDNSEAEECAAAEKTVEERCSPFGAPEAGYALDAVGAGPAGDLYIANVNGGVDSFLGAFGPAPLGLESPPPLPPSIDAQYAAAVTDTGAEVRAQINPNFFAGPLGPTTYFVQYGTAACIKVGGWNAGCVKAKPSAPGGRLQAGVVSEDVSASVALSGLSPHSAYRYRFVAEGNGAPGVVIVGVGGTEGTEGEDAGFTTYTSPTEEEREGCAANEAFRSGASARLADCRAYEMVSPIDKEGGEVRALAEFTTLLPAVLSQSTVSGDGLAYGSYKAFADAQSAPYTTQYIARREAGAWASRAISPPQGAHVIGLLQSFDTEYKLFSEDLCEGWLGTFADPPLAAGAVAAYPNLYRRENCTESGGYEALTSVQPPAVGGPEYGLELQGVSADREAAIYTATGKLTEDAPSLGVGMQLLYMYERGEPGPRYVCILPGGAPSSTRCAAGGPPEETTRQRFGRIEHALSEDGKRVFWTAGGGAIYLRENPFGEGSECSGAGSPCTIAVSKNAEEMSGTLGKGSQYWGAVPDGSKAIFTTEDKAKGVADLYEFEVDGEVSRRIAGRVVGVLGMSEDTSRIYLVSEEDLDGTGPAAAGKLNLYLRAGGEGGMNMRFVATLASADVSGTGPIATAPAPWRRATRVSSSGEEAVFMSSASLTGYDNHDLQSGKADAEVFLYRAAADGGEGSLICVSCNPAGSRPLGANIGGESSPVWAAAQISVAENNLREARNLTDGGERLYFEATDPLVLGDTNRSKDVYQWEAVGTGGCKEGGSGFVAGAEGCVSLISSGKSKAASEFTEASEDGSNVFFTTLSSLVTQDPGVIDVYDARVNGGLPSPPAAAEECEGESCQRPPAPPPYSAPASTTYSGPGNKEGSRRQQKCPKGKVRRGGRCVKKAQHKKKSNHGRVTGK